LSSTCIFCTLCWSYAYIYYILCIQYIGIIYFEHMPYQLEDYMAATMIDPSRLLAHEQRPHYETLDRMLTEASKPSNSYAHTQYIPILRSRLNEMRLLFPNASTGSRRPRPAPADSPSLSSHSVPPPIYSLPPNSPPLFPASSLPSLYHAPHSPALSFPHRPDLSFTPPPLFGSPRSVSPFASGR
jgi:hypothetical protein